MSKKHSKTHTIQNAWNIDWEMQMMLNVVPRSWKAFNAIIRLRPYFIVYEEPLKDLQQGNDIIRSAFWQAHSGCRAKNWLEQDKTRQETSKEVDDAFKCEVMMWSRMTLRSVDLTQIGMVAEEAQCQ